MDEVIAVMLSVVISTNFLIIKEVYTIKTMFKNHLLYLHKGGVKDD